MYYLEIITMFEAEIMLTLGLVTGIQLMKEIQVTHSQNWVRGYTHEVVA